MLNYDVEQVEPAEIHVPSCVLVGPGASHGIAGEVTPLQIRGRDRFGNNRSVDDGTFAISIHRDATSSQRACTDWGSLGFARAALCGAIGQSPCNDFTCAVVTRYYHPCNTSIMVDGFPTSAMAICPATCGRCPTLVRVKNTIFSDGLYNSEYNLTLARPIQLTLALSSSEVTLKPPPVVIRPAATYVPACLVDGPGWTDDTPAAAPATVRLRLRDFWHNPRAQGGEGGLLSFRFTRHTALPGVWSARPDLTPEALRLDDHGDGSYTYTHVFVPAARYTLAVAHRGVALPDSPRNISKTSVPPPALQHVAFDSSLARLHATFSAPTNMALIVNLGRGPNTTDDGGCSQLLTPASMALLGVGSTCHWAAPTRLVLALGAGAAVAP
jgi:hypothetical protein